MPLTFIDYGYRMYEPDTLTHDGERYRKIERLPRNVKEGDLIIIGDRTDPTMYHQTNVIVTRVISRPQEIRGWRRYAPEVEINFKLTTSTHWRWRSWGATMKYRDSETKEKMSVYRKF